MQESQQITQSSPDLVDDNDIDLIGDSDCLFGYNQSTIPFANNVQPQRLFYGARFVSQSLGPKDREVPLVQRKIKSSDKSFDDYLGTKSFTIFQDDDGEVQGVDDTYLTVKYKSGEKKIPLLKNFPFNRKSAISHELVVKPGDKIKKGQLLQDNSFTKDGTVQLGKNARVQFISYKGWSMDDAGVISESMQQKLQSNTNYGYSKTYQDGEKRGKSHFVSLFPDKYTKQQLDKLDEDGFIKPGETVEFGDPICLSTKKRPISSKSNFTLLSKATRDLRQPASIEWDHHYSGQVNGTGFRKDTFNQSINQVVPVGVGDKLAGRAGQKLVVQKIVPDQLMPRSMDGKIFDILLNPQQLPSRVNLSTPYEQLAGKIQEKIGKPLKIDSFRADKNTLEDIKEQLAQNGLEETEEVFDPESNRKLINKPLTGNIYLLRLHHIGDSKLSYRSQGGYDANEQPSKGSGEGQQAKRFSGLEIKSILSSGAYKLMAENSSIRGQKNDEFWRAYRNGSTFPKPQKPFVWEKFKHLLAGQGFSTKEKDGKVSLGVFTDKDMDMSSQEELSTHVHLDTQTLIPKKGGLFDDQKDGAQWKKITLPVKVIHPQYKNMVQSQLGITIKKLDAVLAGKEEI